MAVTKNNNMSGEQDTIKIVEEVVTETEAGAENAAAESETKAKTKKVRARSRVYSARRAQIDKTKKYDVYAAIEMLKKLSYSKFDGTVEVHASLKEEGASATLTFPHSTGKSRTVVIATDAILADVEAGKIEFDVLVASPDMMPKLAKLARILGPKGLMPNPKTGTLTPNPEKAKQMLEAGSVTIKTEKKAPLIHVVIGKVSTDTKALAENIEALLKAFKGKVLKMHISASMSPSVRIDLSSKE